MKRRRGAEVAPALLFALTLCLAGCGEKKQEEQPPAVRPIKTVVVGGDAVGTRTLPARVEAGQRAILSFRVAGPLVELPIEKGQNVRKDQLVARIDPRDYQIALEEAKANFTKADADFKRYQSLYERNAVSIAELDQRRSQRDVANARLEDAEAALSDTRLLAPFAGTITERFVENHQTVSAQQQIAGLQNFTTLDIVVDLPEHMIARLKRGDAGANVFARFEAAPGREFPLTFREVAAQADPATQTYEVRMSMPSPGDINILTGMSAEVVARLAASTATENRLVVPSVAVFAGEGDGKRYVWVVGEDLAVHRREVQVGEVTGAGSLELTGGVEAGERIAVAAVSQLREGMKVRLLDTE